MIVCEKTKRVNHELLQVNLHHMKSFVNLKIAFCGNTFLFDKLTYKTENRSSFASRHLFITFIYLSGWTVLTFQRRPYLYI